ncbi:MAG: hypothetical protein JSS81_13710 [Acidobacteria bacterium]|nr:hypothetical protein [Acidobacteriota bacterium]
MKETKMNLTNAIRGLVLATAMILSAGLATRAQSTDERFPTPLGSRVMTGVASGNKTYYYSLAARPGTTVTVSAQVAWTRGVSFSLDFRGFRGRDGGLLACCEGDSYLVLDHGSNGARTLRKTFTVKGDGRVMMAFTFNTPNLAYTFTFDGFRFDAKEPAADGDAIIVPGRSGNRWIDTGIDVRRGQTVVLDAVGEVDVSAGWGVHGPAGTRNFMPMPYYPVASRTRYGLAAKIATPRGTTIQAWSYGDTRRMTVTKSGRLFLTANDDAPDDNSGQYEVRVTIR